MTTKADPDAEIATEKEEYSSNASSLRTIKKELFKVRHLTLKDI